MPDTILVDQKTAMPTRKVTAATGLSGLIGGIVTAIVGIFPTGAGEEIRDALTVVIDALVGFLLSGGAAFIGGYFIRDEKVSPDDPPAPPPPPKKSA